MSDTRFPVYFIPHGGGPWPFMQFPAGPDGKKPWADLADFLKSLPKDVGRTPKAILMVSGHWEGEPLPTLSSAPRPGMLYDYYGFPPETYQLTYPAPGAPDVAHRAKQLLEAAGIPAAEDDRRGYDHGVFIPLMVAYPDADVPVVMMSLKNTLDVPSHVAIGKALEPLRDEGVLIVGSGMSYHNMRMFFHDNPEHKQQAIRFDDWLSDVVAIEDSDQRAATLATWERNPDAQACHVPDHDHLVPLFVVAGAAGQDAGQHIFRGEFRGKPYSGYRFG
ncbi:DODA-type extradiol aromatic ring-opening family dioxygenase [Rhizobium cremeum]|uniref:DODA-type extradiol aromatic ring-opening family dioxygenase n=1 Tax=Rhizobium cremeum TaxID=2813827 RepID=UPI000DE57541